MKILRRLALSVSLVAILAAAKCVGGTSVGCSRGPDGTVT